MKMFGKVLLVAAIVPAALAFHAFAAAPGGGAPRGGPGAGRGRAAAPVDNTPRTLAPYFTPATPGAKAPDPEGFLQRWMLLEPFTNNLRGNTGFTEKFVSDAIKTHNFPEQFSTFPKDGDKATLGGQELAWHALDSSMFNVKLFRFAYGLNKTVYGVLFFAQTIVDSPRDMQNVRLAVGSNSASIWWVNGKEAAGLFGDRRMVADDVTSKRLNLKKGANLIQGAVINGPGMSDFCVRFLDEDGKPVKDLTINFDAK